MKEYRYNDNPPTGLLISVVIQAVIIALINCSFLIIVFKAAHIEPAMLVAHQQWFLLAYFFTNIIQCLRFSHLGAGLFMPATSPAIYLAPALLTMAVGGFPLLVGMMIFAALCELIFSFIIHRLRILIPPEINGLAFLIIGIQLCSTGFEFSIGSFPSIERTGFVFLILGIVVAFTIWSKGIFKNLSPLYAAVIGTILLYAFPHALHFTPKLVSLGHFDWIGYPALNSFWPIDISFKWSFAPLFAITGFVATIRTIGTALISNRYESASFIPDYAILKRAIRGDALSSLFSAFTCGLGVNVAPITTTLTTTAKCTSRVIPIGCACIYFILAFSPKIMGLISLMPEILIGVMMIWYGVMMIGSGLKLMNTNTFDIQETYVIGFALFIVISIMSYPNVYNVLSPELKEIIKEPVTTGLILAMCLTLILNIKRKKIGFKYKNRSKKSANLNKILKTFLAKTELSDEHKRYINNCLFEALSKINASHADSDVTVDVKKDKMNLCATLSYEGELFSMTQPSKKTLFSLFDEQIVSAGLSRYFNNMPSDFRQEKQENKCTLTFTFFLT